MIAFFCLFFVSKKNNKDYSQPCQNQLISLIAFQIDALLNFGYKS